MCANNAGRQHEARAIAVPEVPAGGHQNVPRPHICTRLRTWRVTSGAKTPFRPAQQALHMHANTKTHSLHPAQPSPFPSLSHARPGSPSAGPRHPPRHLCCCRQRDDPLILSPVCSHQPKMLIPQHAFNSCSALCSRARSHCAAQYALPAGIKSLVVEVGHVLRLSSLLTQQPCGEVSDML